MAGFVTVEFTKSATEAVEVESIASHTAISPLNSIGKVVTRPSVQKVVSQAVEQLVVTFVPEELIVSVEDIVPSATVRLIGPIIASNGIITFIATHKVIARAAFKPISVTAPVEPVAAVPSLKYIVSSVSGKVGYSATAHEYIAASTSNSPIVATLTIGGRSHFGFIQKIVVPVSSTKDDLKAVFFPTNCGPDGPLYFRLV